MSKIYKMSSKTLPVISKIALHQKRCIFIGYPQTIVINGYTLKGLDDQLSGLNALSEFESQINGLKLVTDYNHDLELYVGDYEITHPKDALTTIALEIRCLTVSVTDNSRQN